MRQHDRRSEDGASLVMVLVFISIFGLILAGLLTEAGASVKYTTNVANHEKLVYAADAGVSAGIQQIQQNSELCPGVGMGTGPAISDVTVNNQTVSVTCAATVGTTLGSSGFAVVTTATGANSLKLSNAQAKKIKGPVFVSGSVSWGPGLQLSNGNFYQLKQPDGSCQAVPTSSQLSLSAPYGVYTCRTPADIGLPAGQLWPDQPHDPPAMPTATPSVNGTDVGSCRIFTPGVYSLPPNLKKGDNYFVSGTYYFTFTGTWNVKQATIYGGQPDPAYETRALVPAPTCATSSDTAYGGTGTGVEWIFGGTSRMYIDTQGSVELFARTGETGASPYLSLVGVPSESAWTSKGYSPNTVLSGTPILEIKDGNKQNLAVHGLLYAPNQDVALTATNSVLAQTLGGMVVSHLTMQSSASAQGLAVAVAAGPPAPREILVTATAHDSGGGRDVVSSAVIQVANDAPKTVTIKSWRTRGPSDAT